MYEKLLLKTTYQAPKHAVYIWKKSEYLTGPSGTLLQWPFPSGRSVFCSRLACCFSRTLQSYDFIMPTLTFRASICFPSYELPTTNQALTTAHIY